MVWIIVCIFIIFSVSQFCCSFIMGILQMHRNRQISGFFHRLHCRRNGVDRCVAFRRACNVGRRLCQNNLRLRHAHPLCCQGCRNRYLQRCRICIANILRRTDHHPAGDKCHAFPSIQHPRQIINRRIRIGAPHTLDKCRNRIVMIIACFVVFYCTFLNTFLGNLQGQMDFSIL